MQLDYPSYINRKLYLVVSLCSTLNRRLSGIPQECGITDYNLLCNWLMLPTDVDREVDSAMTSMTVQYFEYIDMGLAHTLQCSRAYIQMHTTYYRYNNIKEYFHEYQLLKQLLKE